MSDPFMGATPPYVQYPVGEQTGNPVIPFRVTRYRCPTCRKTGSSRKAMQAHANECIHNPAAKGCGTCASDERIHVPAVDGHYIDYQCTKKARGTRVRFILDCPLWEPKAEDAAYG